MPEKNIRTPTARGKIWKSSAIIIAGALILIATAYIIRPRSGGSERIRRWEARIATYEEDDRRTPPAKGGVVFVGSSTISGWSSLSEDFPSTNVLNRALGGSHIKDVLRFVDRIVIPYRPRLVVIYAGENDIDSGKSPTRVSEDFKQFVAAIHRQLPDTRIAFISIKPSPARWNVVDMQIEANKLIRAYIATDQRLTYIDTFSQMIGQDGRPRAELYIEDGLHLNEEGYNLWRSIIRPYIR